MQWILEGIIKNEKNSSFLLDQYNIWDYDWIPISDIDIIVIDPIDMKDKKLNIVKLETEKKDIFFGYLKYMFSANNFIRGYAIFSQLNEIWEFDTIAYENKNYKINGFNIWDYEWFSISRYKPEVKHPNFNQTHNLEVVIIFTKNYSKVRFGYCEFSSGVYGIYLPK